MIMMDSTTDSIPVIVSGVYYFHFVQYQLMQVYRWQMGKKWNW